MASTKSGPPKVDPEIAEMLLRSLATNPSGPMAQVFDEVFYPFVKYTAEKRGSSLARRIGRKTHGKDIFIPGVLEGDADAVAHDTATLALQRLRRTAKRYDPAKGTALQFIVNAAAFAYVDVVRNLYRLNSQRFAPLPNDDAFDPPAADPSKAAENSALVACAMRDLNAVEQEAVALKYRQGHTYAEIAEILFGDSEQVKKVEHLISTAKAKMRTALARVRA